MTDTTTAEPERRTADRTRLEGLLRDIYAVAAFFTTHPELPMPWLGSFSINVPTLDDVQRLADMLGVERIYADGRQFHHVICTQPERRIEVVVRCDPNPPVGWPL